jgi:hypothetical protein
MWEALIFTIMGFSVGFFVGGVIGMLIGEAE